MKEGFVQFERLVNVKGVTGLNEVKQNNGEVHIGALSTHRELESSPILKEKLPALVKLEQNVANVRVRQVGTIGGNLCFAEPHADPGTLLIALGARLVAEKGEHKREITAESFFVDAYETALEPDEVLTQIIVPVPVQP
jgi:carbon-monoxide dehydrogenase medium subunit